eukprot:g6099.t1
MGHGGNNVIPNVHFRKVNGCQAGRKNRVFMRTWLNQAGRKKRRANARKEKAASLGKVFPRPSAGLLRPLVHPPTQRYNMKLRLGKGFTLDELKEAKIPRKFAKTIGIAIDHRRRNRCTESLQRNVERLKLYMSKLVLFPKKSGAKGVKKGDTPRSELQNVAQNTLKEIIPVPKTEKRIKARAITAEALTRLATYTVFGEAVLKQQVPLEGGGCFSKRFIYEEFPSCLQDVVTNYMILACISFLFVGLLIGIILSFDIVIMGIAMGAGVALALLGASENGWNMERMHMDTVHMLCAEVSQETENLSMQLRKAQRGDCCYELNMRIYVPSEPP